MTSLQLTPPPVPSPVPTTSPTTEAVPGVEYDFYREIHKGIRYAAFHTTIAAGRLDVHDADALDRFATGHHDLLELLHLHHHHEDTLVRPLVLEHAPALAQLVDAQHGEIEAGMAHLRALGAQLAAASRSARPGLALRLYLDLTRMTSAYLAHQLVEEAEVMPALRKAVPTEELLALDMAIRMSVPPDVMAGVMRFMLPSMNVDERADMLGGMSMAPPEVFAGFRAVAQEALTGDEWAQVAHRLGLE